MANTIPIPDVTEAILELTTPKARRFFRVDGESYFFRHPDELNLLQAHRMQRLSEALMAEITDEASAGEKDRAISDILMIAVIDGDSMLGQLGIGQKVQLIQSFLAAPPVSPAPVAPQPKSNRLIRSK